MYNGGKLRFDFSSAGNFSHVLFGCYCVSRSVGGEEVGSEGDMLHGMIAGVLGA